jgi:hypothetical protein
MKFYNYSDHIKYLVFFSLGSGSRASRIIRMLPSCPYIQGQDKGKILPVFTELPCQEDLWWNERRTPYCHVVRNHYRHWGLNW